MIDVNAELQRLRQCLESPWIKCSDELPAVAKPPGAQPLDWATANVWFVRWDGAKWLVESGQFGGPAERFWSGLITYAPESQVCAWRYRYDQPTPELGERKAA
jgi:hypothetical protein